MVHDLNDQTFSQKIFDFKQGGDQKLLITKPTILEFWESWCPHCQAMIPRYEKVSENHPDWDCYRVELDDHPELGQLFDVTSFPTFIFIKQDGKMEKWVGEVPETELEKMATEYLG